jgi:hypothetical protein
MILIQEMRPGSLSKQYSVCGKPNCRCVDSKTPKKHGPYYQLSYVYNGKNTSRFIQAPYYQQVKHEVENYKKFKLLVDQWIGLALQYSEEKISQEKSQSRRLGRK